MTLRASAGLIALVLVACGGTATPEAPRPSITIRNGGAYVTLHYGGYPETAKERGSCAKGYLQTDPHVDAPGPDFRCVYNASSDDPIHARFVARTGYVVTFHPVQSVELPLCE